MGYQTNRNPDPDAPHILDAPMVGVEPPGEAVDPPETPVGFDNTDYTYNPVMDTVDHEADTSGLSDKEVPRHDRYASENSGFVPDVILPGGVTNAHPDWKVGESVEQVSEADQAYADAQNEIHAQVAPVTDDEPVVVPEPEPRPDDGVPAQQDDPDTVYVAAQDRPELEPDPETEEVAAETTDTQSTGDERLISTEVKPPNGNASAAEWRAYAVSQGMDPTEADNLGRDEIRDTYITGS